MFRFADIAGLAGEVERQQVEQLVDTLQFDDSINIQFTSGTTGSPKGATLTHHNILNNGYFVGRVMQFSNRDRLCIPVPLYHCFGMVLGNLACMTHGATMVFPLRHSNPWQCSKRSRPSAVRRCMASRPCLSPNSITPSLAALISAGCAPGLWLAPRARLK